MLNNTKWNAAKLLNEVVSMLGDEIRFAEVNHYKKENYTRIADDHYAWRQHCGGLFQTPVAA